MNQMLSPISQQNTLSLQPKLYPWPERQLGRAAFSASGDSQDDRYQRLQLEKDQQAIDANLRLLRQDLQRAQQALRQASRYINSPNGTLYF